MATKINNMAFIILAITSASGCAAIIEGTSQKIEINTRPQGASCTLNRDELQLGKIDSTPGTLEVKKDKGNIVISCSKVGFTTQKYTNKSDISAANVGNFVLGGLGFIGSAIDTSMGADNKYESSVTIELSPSNTGTVIQQPEENKWQ